MTIKLGDENMKKMVILSVLLAVVSSAAFAAVGYTAKWICPTCGGRYVTGPSFPTREECEDFLDRLQARTSGMSDAKCVRNGSG